MVFNNVQLAVIYVLIDPITSEPRYIGKTKHLKQRYKAHLRDNKKKTHKNNWIKSLKSKGLEPILEIVDEVLESNWQFWERHYISLYKSWGFNLTNTTNGGEGSDFRKGLTYEKLYGEEKAKEVRLKLSESHKGQVSANKGKKYSQERCLRMSLAGKENPSLGFQGKKHSIESKKKMSLKRKGRIVSDEVKNKVRASLKGRKKAPFTVEHREKLRLAKLGNKNRIKNKK